MIDKTAGLPTQIRQLEKRLKEMDASKVKPALVKEITDTIKNLKDMLKEKQDKRELRKQTKEQAAQQVQKEAITVPSATEVGAVAPNDITTTQPGQPEATPTTPDDMKVSCPLCGGMTFNDQASYQQHMEFTHASDVMPTTPGQKLDKTVAAIEPTPIPSDPQSAVAPAAPEDKGPQFKLDDEVKPIRGGDSKGKVMRWDGKPNDLVYVMWESGPLADRDTFGGYYPHDLQAVAQEPVEAVAAPVVEEPVCEKCADTQKKHGDLKTNYQALLKDLQEEREIHYTQGNNAWVARLDQKIVDLQNAIAEKFPSEPSINHFGPNDVRNASGDVSKKADGGPELIRQINKATSGHGYDATVYDLTNGRFQQNVPLKINDTNVRMKQPENGTFELKYSGMPEWRPVLQPEFDQWLAEWKKINETNNQKEGAAENAKDLTIMDHTPPQANSGPDAGGTDSHDEFQDEWAMPITSATKLNVFKRELLATPSNEGYDISHEGKKLFNIKGKENKPMNRKQLEFCAQIEFTRGMKQAKLVEKIANLEVGSTVFVMAHDKTTKRVKFASMEHGFRGWAPASKFAYLVKEGEMRKHNDHIDNTFGHNGKQMLCDCPNGSGNMAWVGINELLPINPPPATPESLNDIDSAKGYPASHFARPESKGRADQSGLIDVEDADLSPEGLAAKKREQIEGHDIEAGKKCQGCGKNIESTESGSYCKECKKEGNDKKASRPTWRTCKKCGKDFCTSVYRDYCSEECHKGAGSPKEAAKGCAMCGGHMLKTDVDFCSEECRDDNEKQEKRGAQDCPDCHGHFEGAENEKCPTCGRFAIQKTAIEPALPKAILPQRGDASPTFDPMNGPSDEDVQQKAWEMFHAHWNALGSEQMDQVYQALGVTSSLKKQATVTHREDGWHVLSEKGKNLGGPYKSKEEAEKRLRQVEYFKHQGSIRPFSRKVRADALTDHITDMKGRITETQDRLQSVPAVKTAVVTDETIQEIDTNDPNAVVPTDPNAAPAAPTIQNVIPTDDDNLEIPVTAPTSPPAPGQKWVFDTQFNKYVSMPDPAATNQTI